MDHGTSSPIHLKLSIIRIRIRVRISIRIRVRIRVRVRVRIMVISNGPYHSVYDFVCILEPFTCITSVLWSHGLTLTILSLPTHFL